MTRRRLLPADVGRMAIGAFARLPELLQLSFDRHRLRVGRLLALAMTRRASVDWHVRRQPAQSARARDVDVARRALGNVLALAAFVCKLCRNAFRLSHGDKRGRGLVATRAVILRRLLVRPVTIETRIMRARHRLERVQRRGIRVRRRQSHDRQRHVGLMTDRAIVVIGFLIIEGPRLQSVMRFDTHRLKSVPRNHVLMFVMRKLYGELALVFRLRLLFRIVRLAESKAAIFARRRAHMTNGADSRPGSNHRLAREKLLPVTTHTRVVIWKVGHVRKISLCRPRRRNLVAFIACETLMLVRRMKKR